MFLTKNLYRAYFRSYFRRLEKELNGGGGDFWALFYKKMPFFVKKHPFWPILNALNF